MLKTSASAFTACLILSNIACVPRQLKHEVVEADGSTVVKLQEKNPSEPALGSQPQNPEAASSLSKTKPNGDPSKDSKNPETVFLQKIEKLDSLFLKFGAADVFVSEEKLVKKSELRVVRLDGPEDCRVDFRQNGGAVDLLEAGSNPSFTEKLISGITKLSLRSNSMPAKQRCRFEVTVGLRYAAPIKAEIVRGDLTFENWNQKIEAKVEWGEVNLGNVKEAIVHCGYCNLTGEEVHGPLLFQMQEGNVGLSGLSASVDGSTAGDAILKFSKLRDSDKVKVLTRSGDMMLFMPPSGVYTYQAKALRGDVIAHFKMPEKTQGIPLELIAESGNIHLYRAGKSSNASGQ